MVLILCALYLKKGKEQLMTRNKWIYKKISKSGKFYEERKASDMIGSDGSVGNYCQLSGQENEEGTLRGDLN